MRPGSKMFDAVTRTWNPIICYPCYFSCIYCWVPYIVKRFRLRTYLTSNGRPVLLENRLRTRFREGELVFVCDMCDMFSPVIPDEYIVKVLDAISRSRATFLLLTKNPSRYLDFEDKLSRLDNVLLGATIETNRDGLYVASRISRAPSPNERIMAMAKLADKGFRTFVSIEPVIDFDLETFVDQILGIRPVMVYVGYDNYGKLPRWLNPPVSKVLKLIETLRNHGLDVRVKTIPRDDHGLR